MSSSNQKTEKTVQPKKAYVSPKITTQGFSKDSEKITKINACDSFVP